MKSLSFPVHLNLRSCFFHVFMANFSATESKILHQSKKRFVKRSQDYNSLKMNS